MPKMSQMTYPHFRAPFSPFIISKVEEGETVPELMVREGRATPAVVIMDDGRPYVVSNWPIHGIATIKDLQIATDVEGWITVSGKTNQGTSPDEWKDVFYSPFKCVITAYGNFLEPAKRHAYELENAA